VTAWPATMNTWRLEPVAGMNSWRPEPDPGGTGWWTDTETDTD
jgi:hypothetical protein